MAVSDESSTASTSAKVGYVDIYLLPVPEDNLEVYKQQALVFATAVKQHGGLSYREFRGDDLGESLEVGDGTVLTSAVAEFESRAHRDSVMSKVMDDDRVKQMMKAEETADMSKMRFGGFETLVDPQ